MNLSQIPHVTAPEKITQLKSGLHRYRDGALLIERTNGDQLMSITVLDERGQLLGVLDLKHGEPGIKVRRSGDGEPVPPWQAQIVCSLDGESYAKHHELVEHYLAAWMPGDLLPENREDEGGQQHTIKQLREQVKERDATIKDLREDLRRANEDAQDKLEQLERVRKVYYELLDDEDVDETLRRQLDELREQLAEAHEVNRMVRAERDEAGEHARSFNAELGEVKEERNQLDQRLRQLVEDHQAEVRELEGERDRLQAKVKGLTSVLDTVSMQLHQARQQASRAAREANDTRAELEAVRARRYEVMCQAEPMRHVLGERHDAELREQLRPLIEYVAVGTVPESLRQGTGRQRTQADSQGG